MQSQDDGDRLTIARKAMLRRVLVMRSPETAKPYDRAMFPRKVHTPRATKPIAQRLPILRMWSVSSKYKLLCSVNGEVWHGAGQTAACYTKF